MKLQKHFFVLAVLFMMQCFAQQVPVKLIPKTLPAKPEQGFSLKSWLYDEPALVKLRDNPNKKPSDYIKMQLAKLPILNLSGLNIISLDGLQDIPNKNKITHLSLSNNRLSTLPSMKDFVNLVELDLTANKFKQFDFKALEGLDKLEKIYLFANELTHINQLPALKGLKVLGLSNNQISSIASNAFKNVPQIEIIQLDGNKLEKFDRAELTKDLKKLAVLNLTRNPLK